MMGRDFNRLRGSRRTRPLAVALAGLTLVSAGIVVAALGAGMVAQLSQGTDTVELMAIAAIDRDEIAPADIAPSRPAPAAIPQNHAPLSIRKVAPTQADFEDVVARGPASSSDNPPSTVAVPAGDVVSFDHRPLRPVKTLRMRVTAYSPDERSCGIWADGITASGFSVWTNGMKLVAADTDLLPFGSIVTIPGYNAGKPVPVLDRGGAIKGRRLDVLYPTHDMALQWGVQHVEVTVWAYADE